MEQNWTDYLVSTDIDNNFKILISSFFMPDKILVKEFIANMYMLKGGEESYFAKEYATKSLKHFQRAYPPLYPNWFIASYPDVVNWVLDNHEKSSVFTSLTEERLMELEQNSQLKNDFIRKLINEYRSKVSSLLECTEDYNINIKEELLKYPKREFDSLGRLSKEIVLEDEYETTSMFHYNEKNQICRIDRLENNAFGTWELEPFETFDFDSNGFINKYVKYQLPFSKLDSEIYKLKQFSNVYDANNRLISTQGPFKTPMYKSREYDLCLKINYVGEEVEVLYDHEFYDLEYNANIETINQLNIQLDNEDSKELRKNLGDEISLLRYKQQSIRKQKTTNMQMDRFYKKESDSRYTLIARTSEEELFQKLLSFTDIDQFTRDE